MLLIKPLTSTGNYLQATEVLEGACAAAHLLHHVLETTSTTATLALLGKEAELALLGHVAECAQLADSLLARRLLATAYNATTLGLDQVLLVEATGSVLGSAVPHLSLGAYGLDVATASHVVATGVATVLARVTTSISHF